MDAKPFKKIPSVGTVMTPFPYFVNTDDTVEEIERLMDEHDIRHVPVQRAGRVVGIVSERDLHHRINRALPKEEKRLIHAGDVMVADPYVTAFDAPLNEVATEMAKRHIGSAIILHHGKLAGVLSVTDVCRLLAKVLDTRFPPGGDDDAA